MPLVNAKCTNCGANLTVDESKDAAICEFCGAAYIVEKAVQNYQTVNNYQGQVVNVINIYQGQSDNTVQPQTNNRLCRFESVAYLPGSSRKFGWELPLGSIEVYPDGIKIKPFSSIRFARTGLPERLLFDEILTYDRTKYFGWKSLSFSIKNGSSHTFIFKHRAENFEVLYNALEENTKKNK